MCPSEPLMSNVGFKRHKSWEVRSDHKYSLENDADASLNQTEQTVHEEPNRITTAHFMMDYRMELSHDFNCQTAVSISRVMALV